MSSSAGVSRKAEDAYPTGASSRISQFYVDSICLLTFLHVLFWLFYVLSCVCVSISGLCSRVAIDLISKRILVHLIIL